MIGRAGLCTLAIALVLTAGSDAVASDSHRSHPVVVELYTSQGCADCPLADEILAELSRRNDVVALSFPITYWDMLGWKDTLASMANTDRQKSYAGALGRSTTYTPQLIIDGVEDVVGNQRHAVLDAIGRHFAQRSRTPSSDLDLELDYAGGELAVTLSSNAQSGAPRRNPATIWLMPFLSEAEVNVEGGENADKMLRYTNVVREIRQVGTWGGGSSELSVPLPPSANDYDGVAVIVQDREYGEVLAARILDALR